eukprot:10768876-Ditylum_brightwellii.AAC.1
MAAVQRAEEQAATKNEIDTMMEEKQDAIPSSLAQAAQLLAEVQKKAVKPVINQYVRAKDNSSNKKDSKNVTMQYKLDMQANDKNKAAKYMSNKE